VAIPPDQVAGDTIPAALAEAAESFVRLPVIPPFPDILPQGWAAGRWVWTREELARLPGMTLLDFLEQLPGITRFRAGGFGRPAGLTTLGGAGGRFRVFLDGFELDPFGGSAAELETLALLDVRSLRVERSLSGLRVDVETYQLHRPEPYSVVELGTGASQIRLLRALFSRGIRQRTTLTGAFDIVSTGGLGIREDYSQSNAAFRLSHGFGENTGVQLEWRRTSLDRAGDVYPRELTRSDFVVRATQRLSERLVVEGIAGRSGAEENGDPLVSAGLRSMQGGARAGYSSERLGVEAAVRVRGGEDESLSPLPDFEAEGRSAFRPFRGMRLEAQALASSADDERATSGQFTATATPLRTLSIFGSASVGTRLVPHFFTEQVQGEEALEDALADSLFVADVAGWRAGAEAATPLGTFGVAAFQTGETELAPIGLAFDRSSPTVAGESLLGAEAYFDIPVPRTSGALRLNGWFTYFDDPSGRPYTPASIGKGAITFHRAYYEGQLEPVISLEGVYRGSTLVPNEEVGEFTFVTEPTQSLNFYLSFRIIDVRAFLLWENLLNNQTAIDLPGVPPAYPRIVYGASWQFTN
jgi:hypothetical protein